MTVKIVRLGGRDYTLADEPFTRGGQAAIYRVREDTELVVKIYDDPQAYTTEEPRIAAMCEMRPLADASLPSPLAWPTAVARHPDGGFRGYAMRRFDRSEYPEIGALLDPNKRRVTFGERAGWKSLLVIAQNVADVVDRMHESEHELVVGDLSDRNIIVSKANGHSTFLDCDSMGFLGPGGRSFPALMQTPGYTAPELAAGGANTRETDRFALAILIYQLLTDGHHPFEGQVLDKENWTTQDNIEAGNCFLTDPGRFVTAGRPSGPGTFILPKLWIQPKVLPAQVADMARKAFGDGLRRPELRPSAKDWWFALEDGILHVNPCSRDARHTYAEHLADCPWCDLDHRVTMTLRRPEQSIEQVTPKPKPPPRTPLPLTNRPLSAEPPEPAQPPPSPRPRVYEPYVHIRQEESAPEPVPETTSPAPVGLVVTGVLVVLLFLIGVLIVVLTR